MPQIAIILPTLAFILILGLLYWLKLKAYSFNIRVMLSLILGIGFGLCLQGIFHQQKSQALTLTLQASHLIGDGYLSLLKMLVIPLLLTSIVDSIVNMGDLMGKLLKALALRSVFMLLALTAIASAIGIGVALLLHVGQGLTLPQESIIPSHQYTGFVATVLHMLPSNPILDMTKENTLALALFSTFLGISALLLYRTDKSKAEAFKQFIHSSFEVVKMLARLVIALTPYGTFGLLTAISASQGFTALYQILNYIGAMYLAMILVLLLHAILLTLSGVNIFSYIKRAYSPFLVALVTRSSFGTLPVTEETLREKFKINQITSSFVPSIGATLGMNACAGVFPAVMVVMAMTILHQPITWHTVLLVMFVNAIASLGISGIPGTAFIAATVSLTALGLPYTVVGLVQGVDAIVDMGRTATNVNGVMTTSIIVDKSLNYDDSEDVITASEQAEAIN